MAKFENLPGVFVTKLDGGVRIINGRPSNLVLVMGTAPAGPTGQIYVVGNTSDAQSIFDPDNTGEGTLLNAMYETLNGGAPLVGLYRIGTQASYLDFVGPYRIEARYGGTNGLDAFKFYYYHPTNHLKIFNASDNGLIYDNDPNDPVNYGLVNVSLSHPELVDSSEFSAFNDANMEPMTYAEWKAYAEANGLNNTALSGTLVASTNTITMTSKPDVLQEGSILQLTGTANSGKYEVLAITEDSGTYTLTVRPYNYDSDRSLNAADLSFAFADNGGSDDTFSDGRVLGAIYDGDSGLSMNYEQKFEAYQKAYYALESVDTDEVIMTDAYLDVPNIVANDGTIEVPSITDYLGLLNIEDVNSALSFMWDNNNDGLAERMTNPVDIGLDGAAAHTFVTDRDKTANTLLDGETTVATFHEANFAFELAKYLHNLSENDNEAYGFIGVMPPTTMNRVDINKWAGRMPTYDPATGDITVNGSGLLGNKFMVGTLARNAGFFLTSTGYLDGPIVKDSHGAKIDLGKYLNVVAHWVHVNNANGNGSYTTSGAATYGGFVASLPVDHAPTNKKMTDSIGLAFTLHKRVLDQLTKYHYVTFTPAADGTPKVVDAPTAATDESDWRRLMTVRIVAELVDQIRRTGEPYVGNIFNEAIRGSLEQEINALILERQKAGYLLGGMATVTQSRAQAIAGEATVQLSLRVNGELRRLNVIVALHA